MQFYRDLKKRMSTLARNLTALSIMMMVCIGSVVTVMASTVEVTIVDNGEKTTVSMINPTEEGVVDTAVQYEKMEPVADGDEVSFDEETWTLTVRRQLNAAVTADGETRTVALHYGDTAASAVEKAGFTLGENDVLSMDENTVLKKDAELSITRYYYVNVTADGESHRLLVKEGDVASALKAASIELGEEDLVDTDLTGSVSEGQEITVSRVTYEE